MMQSTLQGENAMADDGNMRYEFRVDPHRPIKIYRTMVLCRQPLQRWPNQLETVINLQCRLDQSLMNPDQYYPSADLMTMMTSDRMVLRSGRTIAMLP